MRLSSQMILIALLALGWSSLASAEDAVAPAALDPSALAAIADMELDAAFEHATAPADPGDGPTTMRCRDGAAMGDLETCVVTADGSVAAMPAALAQH
jgi:hypothetical protein